MDHLDAFPSKPVDPASKPSPAATSETLPLDKKLERNAIRKLDCTILPVMTMFYLLSFLVSVAYSIARMCLTFFLEGSSQYWCVVTTR